MNIYILDACALIAVLAMEEGADNIRKLFQKTVTHEAVLIMNKFNFLLLNQYFLVKITTQFQLHLNCSQ
jgi:PIN domain nuclease of toxin-antitoxin system